MWPTVFIWRAVPNESKMPAHRWSSTVLIMKLHHDYFCHQLCRPSCTVSKDRGLLRPVWIKKDLTSPDLIWGNHFVSFTSLPYWIWRVVEGNNRLKCHPYPPHPSNGFWGLRVEYPPITSNLLKNTPSRCTDQSLHTTLGVISGIRSPESRDSQQNWAICY